MRTANIVNTTVYFNTRLGCCCSGCSRWSGCRLLVVVVLVAVDATVAGFRQQLLHCQGCTQFLIVLWNTVPETHFWTIPLPLSQWTNSVHWYGIAWSDRTHCYEVITNESLSSSLYYSSTHRIWRRNHKLRTRIFSKVLWTRTWNHKWKWLR